MKIPVGRIAAWIGRTLLTAIVSEAAERLSRPKPADDRTSHDKKDQQSDQQRFDQK